MPALTRKHILESRKRKTRSKYLRRLIAASLLFVIVTGILGWYLFSEKFYITQVTLEGRRRISEDDIHQYIQNYISEKKWYVMPQDRIWSVPAASLAAGMKSSFPTLKEVAVSKEYPHTLDIHIEEYDGWGVLCQGTPENCFWIDQQGVAFDGAQGFSGTIVPKIRDERNRQIKLGEQQLSVEMMNLITFFNGKALSDDNLQSLQFTIAEKDQTLRVRTRTGWEILLLESTDPEEAYRNLKTALVTDVRDKVSNLEYIDLRFGNRIFYKLKQ